MTNELSISVQRLYKLNNFNIVDCILNMKNRLKEGKLFFFFQNNFIFIFPNPKYGNSAKCQYSIQVANYPNKISSVILIIIFTY